MTWLLVEDDTDIRNVVAVMMMVWGEKPLPFPDGSAAWEWLDSVEKGAFSGELPDLALMDIRMPGYTGDKVAARIRQTAKIKDIPIILMTAFSLTDAEIKDMMEQTGVDHLINKPLPDMDVFRTTLYRIRDERKVRVAKKAEAAPSPQSTQSSSVSATTSPAAPSTTPSAPVQPAAPQPSPVGATPAAAPAQPSVAQPTTPSVTPVAPTQGATVPQTAQPPQAAPATPPAAPATEEPKKS